MVIGLPGFPLSLAFPEFLTTAETLEPSGIVIDCQHYKPYCWGGTGPSCYDCSGLVQAAYHHAGISLPRTTYAMLASSRLHKESHSAAHRCDLAFFGTGHVELYDHSNVTFGALKTGTKIGYHFGNAY